MIVSFKHRFIFVAIPKTATHSIRTALRPQLGERDWEQCVLFEKRYFPVEALANIGHGHITCEEVRPFLLPEMWEGFYRFCTVRNPFDRFSSFCHFIHRDTDKMRTDPLGTMKAAIEDGEFVDHVLFRPQNEFVADSDGRLAVDRVMRIESLEEDFGEVCGTLGLKAARLERINSSRPEQHRDLFDEELIEMVAAYFEKDFRMFDYAPRPGEAIRSI